MKTLQPRWAVFLASISLFSLAAIAVDIAETSLVWRGSYQDGENMHGSAISPPSSATIAGQTQLLVRPRERLASVDNAIGKESRDATPFGRDGSLVAESLKSLVRDEWADMRTTGRLRGRGLRA